MTIRTSDEGLDLITELEGCKLRAYLDGGGVPTIGVGHTRGVKMGDTCTPEQARTWLLEDVEEAEATILRHIPARVYMALPSRAWDALVAFVFNLGEQAFKNPSTGALTGFARALLHEQWPEVAAQMRRWVYDNGKKVKGLENRRKREIALWESAWTPAP